jgi:hypothetical protein
LALFAVLLAANSVFAAGGTIKLVTDNTADGYYYGLGESGTDRYITQYVPTDFDVGAVMCSARASELNQGAAPLGTMSYTINSEDAGNPGFPDLAGGLIVTDDATINATAVACATAGLFVNRSFDAGNGGVPYPGGNVYLTAIEPVAGPGGPGSIDFCGIRLDTSSSPQGRSKTYSGGAFGNLPWNHMLEMEVFEPKPLDLTFRATGSARFPGDTGIPIVYVNRSHAGAGPTDDNITVRLVVDVEAGQGTQQRNVEICADQTPIGNPNKKRITGFFREIATNVVFNGSALNFPEGRSVINLHVNSNSVKGQAANVVNNKGPLNLPFFAFVDDPNFDPNQCELDGLTPNGDGIVDEEQQVLGLRRRPCMSDDDAAEVFFVVQAVTVSGDALNVRCPAIDMPKVDYLISGLEVVGAEFGASNLPGLDNVEVRREDAVIIGSPDLSASGVVLQAGTTDDVGEFPITPGLAVGTADTITIDTADAVQTVSGVDPLLVPNLFARALLLAGESLGTGATAVGADQAPGDTLLGNSSFTTSGVNPATYDISSNFMIRILTDGEGGTLPNQSVQPAGSALARPINTWIAIDKDGNRIQ